MAAIHVTEAEAARDLPALLLRVKAGDEVQIEGPAGEFRLTTVASETGVPFARYTSPRPISDILAEVEKTCSGALLDPEYSRYVEEYVEAGQEETFREWEAL